MRVAVPKEIKAGEKRVALVPDVINKLTRLGLDVVIEAGAGTHSQATDADFAAAGATVNQGDVLALSKFNINPILPRSCPRYPLQGLGAVQDLCVQSELGTHDQAMDWIFG